MWHFCDIHIYFTYLSEKLVLLLGSQMLGHCCYGHQKIPCHWKANMIRIPMKINFITKAMIFWNCKKATQRQKLRSPNRFKTYAFNFNAEKDVLFNNFKPISCTMCNKFGEILKITPQIKGEKMHFHHYRQIIQKWLWLLGNQIFPC